jgi:hypothetical protein
MIEYRASRTTLGSVETQSLLMQFNSYYSVDSRVVVVREREESKVVEAIRRSDLASHKFVPYLYMCARNVSK